MFIDTRDLRLLAAQGLTIIGIAEELGVPVIRVRRAALQYGIDIPFGERQKKRASRADKLQRIRDMAAEGKTLPEIAQELGLCYSYAAQLVRASGAKPVRAKYSIPAVVNARNEKMAAMYRQGLTLEKIGGEFDLTHERVRQILRKLGVIASEGGGAKMARSNAEALRAAKDARSLAKFGLPAADMVKWRKNGVLRAYRMQLRNANSRGIAWGLTFAQWIDVWLTSGKLELRGRGKGHYCMSRIKDTGGYVVGNVHIQLTEENGKEAARKWRGKRKANRGVYLLYPGSARPWLASVGGIGGTRLGFFATEDEAVAARESYVQANGLSFSRDGRIRLAA